MFAPTGVFVAKGDVGVGTIVGSAVFNILFVVGICGVLKSEHEAQHYGCYESALREVQRIPDLIELSSWRRNIQTRPR